ncbi:hypothetical protein AAC387_Pa01g0552 [Persea americana]|eukprot:TRINITY_DN1551_c0_g1_i1.p1 TRINITY_DN1551_c0_g1~~TRINITY_DN1551_c0_g1_i1.p1  ORF type:complete len:668 (-),score=87.67 TRINITY_DN1551_c0_g1_i1:1794-3797(-)
MCSGPDSSKRRLSPPGFSMESGLQKQKTDSCRCSSLLEFSAADDLASFKKAVEEGEAALEEAALWYGRRIGTRQMGFDKRTPLMIAALYGSVEILKYILSKGGADVNRACGSDGATALHCAAAGGSPLATEIVRLLVAASASVESVDAAGNRAGDVLPASSPAMKPKKKVLEMMLKKVAEGEEETIASSSSLDELQTQLQSQPLDQGSDGKKEYPIDLSLPDIKNGIYGTDEFRMYTFKVKPCSRAYSHDWTECPFVHPGENARRRDPRKYHYSCVPCPEFRKGTCRNGDACEYAHGVFECWLHPAQYRTRLCKDETGCTRRVCFFAHKPEELRPLYASTGSAMPSPRSSSSSSPLDLAGISPLALGSPSGLMMPTSTPPMSPVSSPGIGGGLWPPAPLQLPSSRLKSALSARDLQMDMDLVGMEMDELNNLSTLAALAGSRSGKFNHYGSTAQASLDDILASLDSTSLSQLQGLALKSPHVRQNLQSGFSSPMRTASSGHDPSLSVAAAVMNSRAAAFAKRSQSFSERALMNRYTGGLNTPATATTTTPIGSTSSMLSDWGSPNGKLDWGVQGDELHKLRKSASFGIRSNGGSVGAMGAMSSVEEPDVSWVQSLVKDGPPTSAGWPASEQQYQLGGGGGGDFHAPEMFSPWAGAEQLYMEQEQMVA